MINYDVFISCKSEDYPYAHLIYKFLTDELGYVVFLADAELRKKGVAEYGEVIDEALDSAEHLILFSSKVEYINSSYVRNEWRTFLEEKRSGRKPGNILTVLKDITISSLPISLRHFQSFTYDRYKDVKDFLPYSTPKHSSISTPAPAKTDKVGDYYNDGVREEAERKAREEAERRRRLGIYAVGDYYNDGVREGVVFEVSADGRHGKIVSMKQSAEKLEWSSDGAEQERLIGADSETDGAANMAIVKAISGWQSKYPAFKWCADLGEGWYLPSKEELRTIYKNKDKLSPKLTDKLPKDWYWSSTEDNHLDIFCDCCAWYVNMHRGDTYSGSKSSNYYVRAVATFGEDILKDDFRAFVEKKRKAREEAERKAREAAERRRRLGIYRVGDYYNDGVREGVVFEVSADGRHGKIVSMKQSAGHLQWSIDWYEMEYLFGADSETDGAANMAKVKAISGWREKYPAFAWCADLGEGWYLPSKEELHTIYKNKDKLNSNLTDKLSTDSDYWSSTEDDCQYDGYSCAWYIEMSDGQAWTMSKDSDGYVRAVSAF